MQQNKLILKTEMCGNESGNTQRHCEGTLARLWNTITRHLGEDNSDEEAPQKPFNFQCGAKISNTEAFTATEAWSAHEPPIIFLY